MKKNARQPCELDQAVNQMAGHCLALRMRMLNRVISKCYDDALRPLGLKGSQMTILAAAQKAGVVRPAELAERLHLDVSTLSRNVERMKVRGWLEVVPDEDGRAQPFQITDQGRELLGKAIPAWRKAQQHATAMLGTHGVDAVIDIANRLGAPASTP